MPDFVVAGAPRCGTTSLHYYLGQHSRITMSAIKEPNYFLFDGPRRTPLVDEPSIIMKSVSDRDRYEALFAAGKDGIRGEVSPLYLYVPRTPELLADELDDPRVAVVLRHPVDRAWSHFLYTYRGPSESAEHRFAEAVAAEQGLDDTPYRTGTHLLRLGHYGRQLDRYQAALGADRVWIGFHSDLDADAAGFVDDLLGFLGLPGEPLDTSVVHNAAMTPGGRLVQTMRSAVAKAQPVAKKVLPTAVTAKLAELRTRRTRDEPVPQLSEALRASLVEHYADTVGAVEDMTGRTLDDWRR